MLELIRSQEWLVWKTTGIRLKLLASLMEMVSWLRRWMARIEPLRFRLYAIDAPGGGQKYGQEATITYGK